MTLEEMLESFYVDAGLSEDQGEREAIAPEGDVERWLIQGALRLGPYFRKTATLRWSSGDLSVALPSDFAQLGSVAVSDSYVMPAYDEWGNELVFRNEATSDGEALLLYSGYFEVQDETRVRANPRAIDAAGLACISYALSRFFRKLAASRADYRRYSTITGQSGLEASDFQDLADTHRAEFDAARDDIGVGAPASFYGE